MHGIQDVKQKVRKYVEREHNTPVKDFEKVKVEDDIAFVLLKFRPGLVIPDRLVLVFQISSEKAVVEEKYRKIDKARSKYNSLRKMNPESFLSST